MTDTDRPTFVTLLSDVMAFYRQDLSEFVIGVWWQACSRFDLEQVRKAMTEHAMDPEAGRWPPKPADIVRALHGTNTDRALIAWGHVYRAIESVGAYQSVQFDDPAIHAAIVDLGGWEVLCTSKVDDLPFLQRRFCESHRVYARRPPPEVPTHLAGRHERMNRMLGRSEAAPPQLVRTGLPMLPPAQAAERLSA